eukprot:117969-Pyramimonas_sp.AAC.1
MHFTSPLQDAKGRTVLPPFLSSHLSSLWRLCRMPTTLQGFSLVCHGMPLAGIPRDLYVLQGLIPLFWKWQGLLWAF